MKLSEMYQQQLEQIKQQERQQGLQQGELLGVDRGIQTERRAMVESILQVRFGEIDSDLAKIIDQVIAISREEFTPMLLNLSREELLARFKVD